MTSFPELARAFDATLDEIQHKAVDTVGPLIGGISHLANRLDLGGEAVQDARR